MCHSIHKAFHWAACENTPQVAQGVKWNCLTLIVCFLATEMFALVCQINGAGGLSSDGSLFRHRYTLSSNSSEQQYACCKTPVQKHRDPSVKSFFLIYFLKCPFFLFSLVPISSVISSSSKLRTTNTSTILCTPPPFTPTPPKKK